MLKTTFIASVVVVAVLYFWPEGTVKLAHKIADTTITAVKSGANEAAKK